MEISYRNKSNLNLVLREFIKSGMSTLKANLVRLSINISWFPEQISDSESPCIPLFEYWVFQGPIILYLNRL
jgi:hypothetical protein